MDQELRFLHDDIWEKELDLLQALSESITHFIDSHETLSRLLSVTTNESKTTWKRIFRCQIESKLNIRCMYQLKYLEALNECLDIKFIRSFMGKINIAESFTGPLMSHVAKNFENNQPIETWDDISKLAFSVIFKLNSDDQNERGLTVDIVKMVDQIGKTLGGGQRKQNRVRNLKKLREWFETFQKNKPQVTIRDNDIVHDCYKCINFDTNSILNRRIKRAHIIFKMPHDDLIVFMRPFAVNLCTPPVESDNDWLLDLTICQNTVCTQNFSRKLCHDKEIVQQWSKVFFKYEPISGTKGGEDQHGLMRFLLSLLNWPRTSKTVFDKDSEEWMECFERGLWFTQMYREFYQDDLNYGVLKFLHCEKVANRFGSGHVAALLLAILRLFDVLSKEEHMNIIQFAVAQHLELADMLKEKENLKPLLALLPILLSKKMCSEFARTSLDDFDSLLRGEWFDLTNMNESVFRYMKSDAPEHLFRAAVIAVEASQSHGSPDKAVIRVKAATMLKKLLQEGIHVKIATETLNNLETKCRTPRKKKPTPSPQSATKDKSQSSK
jgi:hypothetical protein